MNTTTKQAIREALNALNDAQLTSQPSANYGNLLSGAHKAERILQSALALLDKSGEGEVLTDEEIERIGVDIETELASADWSRGSRLAEVENFKRYARRLRLYLAPSKAPAEGLSPVWSPAEDELDTPCWVTGCKCAIGPICKPDLYCARCGTPIDHSRVDVNIAPASTNT